MRCTRIILILISLPVPVGTKETRSELTYMRGENMKLTPSYGRLLALFFDLCNVEMNSRSSNFLSFCIQVFLEFAFNDS